MSTARERRLQEVGEELRSLARVATEREDLLELVDDDEDAAAKAVQLHGV